MTERIPLRLWLRALAVPRATKAPMLGSEELEIAPSKREIACSMLPELMCPTARPIAAAASVVLARWTTALCWLGCWGADPLADRAVPFVEGYIL